MTVISKKFGTDRYEATYLVDEENEGMRLDQFLQIYLPSFSRQQIKEKIKNKEVQILGRPGKAKPNSTVHHKEHVFMIIPQTEHEDEWWNGEKLELELVPPIIFEDDEILVIAKPPYMATHPTGRHLFNCATVYFENLYNKTVHSVHRIDRETSGVLLLGKNPKSAQQLTVQFEEDKVMKCYFFISIPTDEYQGQDHFIANQRMGPTTKTGLDRVYIHSFPENSEEGKHAETHFKILHKEVDNKYVLGLAFPQTGRQHQIRVHAKCFGLPLLGDKLYLGNFKMFQRFKDVIATPEDHELMQISRHALHAIAINLNYKGKRRTWTSDLPIDLKEWISENITIPIEEVQEKMKKEVIDYFNKLDK